MSQSSVRVKYGQCACVEVPISSDGIVMGLLKLNYPSIKWVKACLHWETVVKESNNREVK